MNLKDAAQKVYDTDMTLLDIMENCTRVMAAYPEYQALYGLAKDDLTRCVALLAALHAAMSTDADKQGKH